MNTSKVRLAFIGAGDVAQRDYLPEFHRIAHKAEITAISSKTGARARAVAAQYNIPHVYDDLDTMLARSDVDAVVNLSPIQAHTQTTLAALQAGKHVYSEKPLASSVADGLLLRDEAARRGLTLVCAPCEMLWPQVGIARELLKAGDIGPVFSARGYGHGGVPPWGGFPSDQSPFFATGGGALRDMGVYPLHALTGLLGPAKRVSALSAKTQTQFVIPDGPFAGKTVPVEEPDHWHLTLDFGDNVIASISANNAVQASRAPELELHGHAGTIALNLIDCGAPVHIMRTAQGWDWHERPVPVGGRASGPDHILGVGHLADCIQTGAQPVLSAAHALHVLDIIDCAYRSARDGQIQTLTHTF
jgi:predicted dehydrogenase